MEGDSAQKDEDRTDDNEMVERKCRRKLNCSCCWKAIVLLVTFICISWLTFHLQQQWVGVDIAAEISLFISTFNQALHAELLKDGSPCPTFFPLVGLILVAAPVGVAVVVMIWALLHVQKNTIREIRRDHRLMEVEKEKEKAEKMMAQYKEKTQDDVTSYQKEQHSDDNLESDLDDDAEDLYYYKPVPILELGSRLQKYWSLDDSKTEIRSMAKKSLLCRLTKEGFDEVNQFLKTLKHPHIQIILSVKLEEGDWNSEVIITQPFWRRGSLRNLINRVVDPMDDYEKKYRADSGQPLAIERVSLYGKQILQAMLYLYKQKFSNKQLCPLGQVQSGNIFIVDDDTCVLGGYENVLLNYRTSLYSDIAHHGLLEYIDIIMFGHVVYEMCTGQSLKNIVPNEEEYEMVMDELCLEILKYIFKRNRRGHLCHGIKKISKHKFFVKLMKPETGDMSESTSSAAKHWPEAKVLTSKSCASLKGAFTSSVDTHTSRSRVIAVGHGTISKNIKGGWRQVKSMGRAVTRSISPLRKKSHHDSLDGQESSSGSGSSRKDMRHVQQVLESDPSLPQCQRHQRAGSWPFSSVQPSAASNVDDEDDEEEEEAAASALQKRD